jgi:hypothetical protein
VPSLGSGTIVYDAGGRSWLYGDPRLTATLGHAKGVSIRPEVLVGDHGCIIARTVTRAADIHMRPKSVSPIALGALLHDLREAQVTRIVLNVSPSDVTIFPTLAAFIGQIDRSVAPRKPTQCLERRLSDVEPGTVLGDLLAAWHRDRSAAGLIDAKELIASRLGNRYLQVGTDATGLNLLVDGLGTGFRVPDPKAFRHWAGQKVSEHPDVNYGRWVAESFGAAMAEGAPLAEDIDCDINWHDEGTRRHVYTRLILPFHTRGGRRVLLGTTVTDVDFDLRAPEFAASA